MLYGVVIPLGVLVVLILITQTLNLDESLSLHIKRSQSLKNIAAVLLAIAAVCLTAWGTQKGLQWPLVALLAVLSVNFLIMGFVPYGRSIFRNIVHDFAAWGSIPIILIFEFLVAYVSSCTVGAAAGLAIAAQLVIVGVYLFIRRLHKYLMFLGEIAYFSTFFIVLIVMEIVYA